MITNTKHGSNHEKIVPYRCVPKGDDRSNKNKNTVPQNAPKPIIGPVGLGDARRHEAKDVMRQGETRELNANRT